MMRKSSKWVLGAVVAAGLAMQLFNPRRPDPPLLPEHDLLATNAPPAPIAALLKNACYDCHSYETKWPWYSHIAPVSWWLDSHVDSARAAMNFSEWPHGEPARERKRWRHIADDVRSGEMPLPSYTWLHPKSRLTPGQRDQLAQWAEGAGGK